jgi:hypothetical protein
MNPTMMRATVLLVALLLAVGRFFIPTHGLNWPSAYEAAAHLFVGGLITGSIVSRRWGYLWLAVALTVVELIAFVSR